MKRSLFGGMFWFLALFAAVQAQAGPLISIRIPEALESKERALKYEDPLHEELKSLSLGRVTKGGTARDSKTNEIAYIWVEAEVSNIDKTLPLLKKKLQQIGAPEETLLQLHYNPARTVEVPLVEKPAPRSYFGIGATVFYLVLGGILLGIVWYFKKSLHLS